MHFVRLPTQNELIGIDEGPMYWGPSSKSSWNPASLALMHAEDSFSGIDTSDFLDK